jgi:predicted Zn-dependent protease
MNWVRPVSIALACWFSITSLSAQRRPMPNWVNPRIQVQVRMVEGATAPHGVMVMVEEFGGGYAGGGQTDSQGKFTFVPSKPAIYVVTVKHPGYVAASQTLDLQVMPSGYAVLELRPIADPRQTAAATPKGGAQISAAALAVPEPAMKAFRKGEKLLMQEQKPEKSVEHFRKAIELYNNFAEAHVLLGLAYLAERKPQEAQRVLEKAVQLDPKLAAAHLTLGASFNQQKNYPAAEQELRKGLELNADAPEGHYELARTYWEMGRWQEAEPHARKAAELRPDMPAVHVLMGNIMLRKNDAPAALRAFKEYLRLAPDGPMSGPTRQMVAKIEKSTEK